MVFHKTDKSTRPVSPSRRRAKSPAPRKSPRVVPKSPVRQAPLRASTPKSGSLKSRTPLRSKSPMRTRSSLGKSGEEIFDKETLASRPSPRLQIEIESDSDIPDGGGKEAEKPKAAVRGRARRLEIQADKANLLNNLRLRETREFERVVHVKSFENVPKNLGEFSDEDDTKIIRKSFSKEKSVDFKQITEFGGPLGSLFFTLFLPIVSIGFVILCNEEQCSFYKLPNYQRFLLLDTYFDLISIFIFSIFLLILAIISVLPFGGKSVTSLPTKQGKLHYTMNGFFACVIFGLSFIALEWKKIPITKFISQHFFHLLIAAIIHGLFLSIYAYIKSFYVPISHLNTQVVTRKNFFYEFFMGRQVHPKLFGLIDLKYYISRAAAIGFILLDLSLVYQSITSEFNWKTLSPTLVVMLVTHWFYSWDALINESYFVTSFEIQTEGCGYMSLMGYLVYFFWMAANTKYVIDYNHQLPNWQLYLISAVFMLGYIIYRGSNNQKDAFRKNPYDPALSHLETIPTTKGTKLICSSYWGFVRHPNYLGDILMNICFVSLVFNKPPMIVSLGLILLLIHRTVRDHNRCKQKYGTAWDRYCHKVKYILLPKIY